MPLPKTFSLLVLGQGSTGLDVVEWALAHGPEHVSSVTVYGGATSEATERTRALEARGARFVYGTEAVGGDYDICVASPGISEFSDFFAAARAHAGEVMGEPEFAWRLSRSSWCAITGTNGKTTTTTLTHHLLDAAGIENAAVGNIGTPTIDAVDAHGEDAWLVAELSSYQIATTSELHPRVAVLLNITPDHLAWHRTHENYALAKIRLFANMDEGDLAIVDVEDEGVMAFADRIFVPGRRVLSLGIADAGTPDAAFVREGVLTVRLAGTECALVDAGDLAIAGNHNVTNALAASAAALFCGAPVEAVRSGLLSFRPLEHRVEPCGEIDGVRFFNDSKATNTDAVEKALTAFPDDDVIVLLGGHDKGTPLEEFAAFVCEHVRAAVCFGEARERFRHAIEEADGSERVDIAEADDLCDAVDVARSLANRGDVVLLSPACSSFDEFSGFEERGRRFKEYVEQLRADGRA
ncbi:UDP-N-acetylmuramoyl-L-alanine--D-glutamate ligase [Collinsella tanakaei]|uniref:UDP-N-acetylmuramoyl-L-alanine--D-glutamate ligase n=1 Tax=Collinsella tanakaei TaxID=626935 RepID=UPI001958E3BB|nr:UDP-N-acetylmuramoyl-L-alanine--D-glutamate ligase [Collinsella tanakaei]MBM6778594.1 UDP-N-acetylmuramoyl-L-alanine--D-glutamate ligase [Collinsella tanakaei]